MASSGQGGPHSECGFEPRSEGTTWIHTGKLLQRKERGSLLMEWGQKQGEKQSGSRSFCKSTDLSCRWIRDSRDTEKEEEKVALSFLLLANRRTAVALRRMEKNHPGSRVHIWPGKFEWLGIQWPSIFTLRTLGLSEYNLLAEVDCLCLLTCNVTLRHFSSRQESISPLFGCGLSYVTYFTKSGVSKYDKKWRFRKSCCLDQDLQPWGWAGVNCWKVRHTAPHQPSWYYWGHLTPSNPIRPSPDWVVRNKKTMCLNLKIIWAKHNWYTYFRWRAGEWPSQALWLLSPKFTVSPSFLY